MVFLSSPSQFLDCSANLYPNIPHDVLHSTGEAASVFKCQVDVIAAVCTITYGGLSSMADEPMEKCARQTVGRGIK